MSKYELAVKARVLSMIEGFPSSTSAITDATLATYVVALAGLPIELISKACARFTNGYVERFSHAKPPTAPELAIEVRRLQIEEETQRRWANTVFVPRDTPTWRAIIDKRGRSMPVSERNGVEGWYVDRSVIEELAPQIEAHRKEMARIEKRGPLFLTQRMSAA